MRYLVHHLLEASARNHPNRPAVIDGDRSLSYRQLEQLANQVARLLRRTGVTRGERVGLYLDKSIEAVVGIYGTMKAGAAYVPLDPDAPVTRLAQIAQDCRLRYLLTGIEKQDRWTLMCNAGAPLETLVVLNNEGPVPRPGGFEVWDRQSVAEEPNQSLDVSLIDQDLAYILYTSGSTGDPKGVMLSHRNALAFVAWAAEEFALVPEDRLSGHAPFHFDLSVFDLFAAAWAGAAVVLVPPKASLFPNKIVRFIRDNLISVWYSVPSILSMLSLRGGLGKTSLPSLRIMLFAGEVFPIKYLRELMRHLPQARFANLYGPTETNVCTWFDVPNLVDDAGQLPIGKPIWNDEVFAVRDDGGRAEIGEVGELHVRGATVMQGYWGDQDRTARVLVPDPFGSELRDMVYRTGDLAEVLEGGMFRLIGRRDSQIKSRGYRIELGDVEATLHAHPGVIECAVVAVPDELFTNRIVAYVSVKDGSGEADLTSFCAARLPRYMIPESFRLVAVLPKTSTGKIDRRSLTAAAAGERTWV